MPSIAALTEAVALAEDEVFRVQQADGFAFTNGAYDRAVSVLRQARRDLNDALVQQITDQAAAIVAAGDQIVSNLSMEIGA